MKKVAPNLYDYNYYMAHNVGHEEFKEGLNPNKVNYKFRQVLQHCSFSPQTTVLDIGCGRGEMIFYPAQKGCAKAIGIDYSSAAIDIANSFTSKLPAPIRNKINFLCIDALELNENQKFDYIFMIDIWEHMYDHQIIPLLSKISNILKDNGVLIIATPNGFYEKIAYPVKRILNIPFNTIKFPLRILRKKWKPKSISDFFSHVFKIYPIADEFADKTHINISTPKKINKMLKNAGLTGIFEFSDNAKTSFGPLFFHFKAQQMLIIAHKLDKNLTNQQR